MIAPSDATRRPHRPPGRLPNNPNPVDPQSDTRRIVTITEDTQQPSITKPAQQPGRPTSICKRRLTFPAGSSSDHKRVEETGPGK